MAEGLVARAAALLSRRACQQPPSREQRRQVAALGSLMFVAKAPLRNAMAVLPAADPMATSLS